MWCAAHKPSLPNSMRASGTSRSLRTVRCFCSLNRATCTDWRAIRRCQRCSHDAPRRKTFTPAYAPAATPAAPTRHPIPTCRISGRASWPSLPRRATRAPCKDTAQCRNGACAMSAPMTCCAKWSTGCASVPQARHQLSATARARLNSCVTGWESPRVHWTSRGRTSRYRRGWTRAPSCHGALTKWAVGRGRHYPPRALHCGGSGHLGSILPSSARRRSRRSSCGASATTRSSA